MVGSKWNLHYFIGKTSFQVQDIWKQIWKVIFKMTTVALGPKQIFNSGLVSIDDYKTNLVFKLIIHKFRIFTLKQG